MGFVLGVCPAVDIPTMRPLPGSLRHRSIRGLPRPPIRSALVVSHHLDGLVRTTGFGFVAPRSQPGFDAFRARALSPHQPRPVHRDRSTLPATRFTPFEEFPSPAAVPRLRGRCPLAVRAPSTPCHAEACTDMESAPTDRPTRLAPNQPPIALAIAGPRTAFHDAPGHPSRHTKHISQSTEADCVLRTLGRDTKRAEAEAAACPGGATTRRHALSCASTHRGQSEDCPGSSRWCLGPATRRHRDGAGRGRLLDPVVPRAAEVLVQTGVCAIASVPVPSTSGRCSTDESVVSSSVAEA